MKWPASGNGGSRSRRNTIDRDDLPMMAAVAVVGAVIAALAGCRPTGNVVGDAVCTGGLAAFTIWLAASASWWVLTLAGLAAIGLAAGSLVPTVCGLAGAACALWLGDRRLSAPAVRCASAAFTVQALVRLDLHPFFGASALLAAGVFLLVIGGGLQRRRRPSRRRIIKYSLVGLAVAVIGVAIFGASAATARSDLQAGYRGLLDGLTQLRNGDARAAAATLHDTAAQLQSAQSGLDSIWTQPARLVPVAAQHQQALAALVGQAARSAEAAADALDVVDFDALTVQGGVIDVQAIAALAEPLDQLQRAVGGLRDAMHAQDSPWLVAPLADRLHEYQQRADDAARQARTIHTAAAVGPQMLGRDVPRRYLIGFASPAEARATVGVMGNYAVITIDDGAISRTEFGRVNDLTNELATHPFTLRADDQFHARYRAFGAGADDDSRASPSFISNVTMTPDMPTAGPLIAQLWVAAGHQPVDGVIILDPTALAGLLEATGPVVVPGLDQPLSSATVVQFLLLDQYALDTPDRRDLLEAVADATLDAVLGGSLPSPQHLAKNLGPSAANGHLLMWSAVPAEEAFLTQIGIDGALPALDGRDGFAVVTNNASANKIDSFLERAINYQATADETTGAVRATMTVALTNTAPATGYPSYVIGSEFLDMPSGTNRTLLTIYSPLDQVTATLDGTPIGMSRSEELGWNTYTVALKLPPESTRTIVIELSGSISPGSYQLVVRPQPTAHEDRVTIAVAGAEVNFSGTISRRTLVDRSGTTALR